MEFIGKGIYSLQDVSKITSISSQRIKRWSNGYTYKNHNKIISRPPLFHHDFEPVQDKIVFSFLDLVEILFINGFQSYGISLPAIRLASKRAATLLNSKHPFAKKQFYTDGKTILAHVAEEAEDPKLLDLIHQQYQISEVVLPYLWECIDFNSYDYAEKYWPLGKHVPIVIDPTKNFGKPILARYNIPTETIYELVSHGTSFKEIIQWYGLDEDSIQRAIQYEEHNVA